MRISTLVMGAVVLVGGAGVCAEAQQAKFSQLTFDQEVPTIKEVLRQENARRPGRAPSEEEVLNSIEFGDRTPGPKGRAHLRVREIYVQNANAIPLVLLNNYNQAAVLGLPWLTADNVKVAGGLDLTALILYPVDAK